MFLVSTTASGADGGNALTTLDGMVTGANFGDPFTADSKHATFYTAVNASGTGTFMSLDLPPTGTASPVSMTGWEGFAATGAKVVYDDNFMNATGSLNGYADIHSVDLSVTPPAPKTVASQADSFFYMTADKSTIVYSWHACPGANEGIYSAAVP
jgi:hypothetical protein